MNDDVSQYKASNFLKKDDASQYHASNFLKKKKERTPGILERAANDVDQYINQPIESLGRSARDLIGGAAQGLINVAPGLYNLGASGANALGANLPKSKMFDFVPHSPSQKAGEIASFFAGPSAIRAFGKIPEIGYVADSAMKIPLIAESIKKASSILGKSPMTSRIAGNALLGGAYNPDNQLAGLALGGAAPIAGKAIEKTYNALKPSKLFRGNLSPEELKKNLAITEGTETGLGDVIGSPFLKRLNENILSKIPFSGVNESMQRTAGKIINRGHGILDQIKGEGNIENLDKHLHESLNKAYKSHLTQKNDLYKDFNKIADDLNLKPELSQFSNLANKYKSAIEDTQILKYEPEMQSLLKKMGIYEGPVKTETTSGMLVDKFGKPLLNETKTTYPTLKEANLLKGKLNTLVDKLKSSPDATDRHLAGVYGELSQALKKDINQVIEKSGNENLKNAYATAENNYAKNYSPFLDKQIYKFLNGNADPETLISSFIKTGKSTDRAELINKLTERLPDADKNLLGYAYLQRALDENNVLNPFKLKTLLSRNALGPKQFESLFPNKLQRNALRNYMELVDKNTKGLKLMQNPETGQMNMDILPLISKSPTSFAKKLIGAPIVAKKLRSEKTRKSLVNKMIKDSENK